MKPLATLCILSVWFFISYRGLSQDQTPDALSQEMLISQNLIHTSSDFIHRLFNNHAEKTYTHMVFNDSILQSMVSSLTGSVRPFLWGKSVLFTFYDPSLESQVSISFKDEKFNTTYPFLRLKANPTILVYAHPREFEHTTIDYRLIINGAWTHDTNNPDYTSDINQVKISRIELKQLPSSYLEPIVIRDDSVRFYFYYQPTKTLLQSLDKKYIQNYPRSEDLVLYLVGNFTSWDPYMIRLQQSNIDDNLYYADVALSPGTYHYYYNMGEYSVLDPENLLVSKRHKLRGFVNTFILDYERGSTQKLAVSLHAP